MTSTKRVRIGVIAGIVAVVIACAVPLAAWAVPGLGTLDSPEPLMLPAHAESQLLSDLFPSYVYAVTLTKGQTIAATITADPAESITLSAWSDEYFGGVVSDYVQPGVDSLSFMAPASGVYFLEADNFFTSTLSTFSVDASIVETRTFALGSLVVPASAKVKHSFTVSARLTPMYNGITTPVRFYVEKKASNGKYKSYTAKTANRLSNDSGVYSKYSYKFKLSKKGTYKIRARFTDAAHSAVYTSRQTIKIK